MVSSPSLRVSPFQKFKNRDLKRKGIRLGWHERSVLGGCGYARHLTFFLNGAWERRGHHWRLSHEWKPRFSCTVSFSLHRSVFWEWARAAYSPSTSVCPGDLGKRCSATLWSLQLKFVFLLPVTGAAAVCRFSPAREGKMCSWSSCSRVNEL